MSEEKTNRCFQPELFNRWAEINREMKELEGKNDEASSARYAELLDELLCVDSALQPSRRAMGNARKPEEHGPGVPGPKPVETPGPKLHRRGGASRTAGAAGHESSSRCPAAAYWDLSEARQMSDLGDLTERELRLTAAVYARLGAARHLRQTGRLPDQIGGAWNIIAMRVVLRERGTDPTLTPDEQLVFDAIIREGRLPGGAVRLVEKAPDREQGPREGDGPPARG
jgi:hypothetical protein